MPVFAPGLRLWGCAEGEPQGSPATERGISMIRTFRFVTHVFPALALAAALAPAVQAGCGDVSTLQAPFVFSQPGVGEQTLMQRAADATRAATLSATSGGAGFYTASIVGMWKIQFISKGNVNHNPSIPDGAMIDFGYTQWHSDGTESRIRAAARRRPGTSAWVLGPIGILHLRAESLRAQLRPGNRLPGGKDPHPRTGDSGSQRKPVHRHGYHRRLRSEIGTAGWIM